MSFNPRALALQGFLLTPIAMAVQGFLVTQDQEIVDWLLMARRRGRR